MNTAFSSPLRISENLFLRVVSGKRLHLRFGNVTENMAKELQNIVDVSFVDEVKRLVEQGRSAAYGAVNAIMIETFGA